jgi:dipeptidyl aminopeptidase/acylaminoacyl peptidase
MTTVKSQASLGRAQRSTWRRGLVALAAAAAILLLGVLLPWPGNVVGAALPAGPTNGPTLPRQFADFSAYTSHVKDRPAGRAIALYEYGSSELFTTWQTIVVGADRDTYRRIDLATDSAPPVLLSPDGTRVLYLRARTGTDEFTLLDLTTGRTRMLHSVEWVSHVGASVDLLAWSPDGRYVAYAVPAPPPADGTAASSFSNGEPIKQLAMLDIAADTSIRYPEISPVSAAAFAPEGQRLVVQTGTQSWIVSVRGERLRPLMLPAGASLASSAAWSPDGRLLATIVAPRMRADDTLSPADARVKFVDVTGAGVPVPGDLPYDNLLGWRSPTTVLVHSVPEGDGVDAIAAVSIEDGQRTVLSTFSRSKFCEYGLQR